MPRAAAPKKLLMQKPGLPPEQLADPVLVVKVEANATPFLPEREDRLLVHRAGEELRNRVLLPDCPAELRKVILEDDICPSSRTSSGSGGRNVLKG